MTSCRFLTRSNLKNEKFLLLSFLIVIAFDRVKVLLFFFFFGFFLFHRLVTKLTLEKIGIGDIYASDRREWQVAKNEERSKR